MKRPHWLAPFALALLVLGPLATVIVACGPGGPPPRPILYVGGIPDQDTSLLVRRFDRVAQYFSETLDVDVEYRPSIDYAAVVTAFANGDIHLAWFGGLTGVQARRAAPGAQAVAQRPRDREFTSAFVVGRGVQASTLAGLSGLSFTFGSVNSTSGHLMPRHFMLQAGVDPETDLNGLPNFSGSHDATWKLVESGAYQSGALNGDVWAKAVAEGRADTARVRQLAVSPPYYDYNWSMRPGLDEEFGAGFSNRLVNSLLDMGDNPDFAEALEAFGTDGFIPTNNDNYRAIEDVARSLGMLE